MNPHKKWWFSMVFCMFPRGYVHFMDWSWLISWLSWCSWGYMVILCHIYNLLMSKTHRLSTMTSNAVLGSFCGILPRFLQYSWMIHLSIRFQRLAMIFSAPEIPSGKLTVCHWKWPFSSLVYPWKMVIFHDVFLPERVSLPMISGGIHNNSQNKLEI